MSDMKDTTDEQLEDLKRALENQAIEEDRPVPLIWTAIGLIDEVVRLRSELQSSKDALAALGRLMGAT